ncbi:unnamed protein product [Amoebophrya sp. A120]|nr:unnamed protein product [Amoebophrya sp. A120]|eukprot:GSA120T00020338001.1
MSMSAVVPESTQSKMLCLWLCAFQEEFLQPCSRCVPRTQKTGPRENTTTGTNNISGNMTPLIRIRHLCPFFVSLVLLTLHLAAPSWVGSSRRTGRANRPSPSAGICSLVLVTLLSQSVRGVSMFGPPRDMLRACTNQVEECCCSNGDEGGGAFRVLVMPPAEGANGLPLARGLHPIKPEDPQRYRPAFIEQQPALSSPNPVEMEALAAPPPEGNVYEQPVDEWRPPFVQVCHYEGGHNFGQQLHPPQADNGWSIDPSCKLAALRTEEAEREVGKRTFFGQNLLDKVKALASVHLYNGFPPLPELIDFSDPKLTQELGAGAFGYVVSGKLRTTGAHVAVKRYPLYQSEAMRYQKEGRFINRFLTWGDYVAGERRLFLDLARDECEWARRIQATAWDSKSNNAGAGGAAHSRSGTMDPRTFFVNCLARNIGKLQMMPIAPNPVTKHIPPNWQQLGMFRLQPIGDLPRSLTDELYTIFEHAGTPIAKMLEADEAAKQVQMDEGSRAGVASRACSKRRPEALQLVDADDACDVAAGHPLPNLLVKSPGGMHLRLVKPGDHLHNVGPSFLNETNKEHMLKLVARTAARVNAAESGAAGGPRASRTVGGPGHRDGSPAAVMSRRSDDINEDYRIRSARGPRERQIYCAQDCNDHYNSERSGARSARARSASGRTGEYCNYSSNYPPSGQQSQSHSKVLLVLKQLFQGIEFLRTHVGASHHDIKRENLMWNAEKEKIQIIDFGIMQDIRQARQQANQINMWTPSFAPREMEDGSAWEQVQTMDSYDIFSLANTVGEILLNGENIIADNYMVDCTARRNFLRCLFKQSKYFIRWEQLERDLQSTAGAQFETAIEKMYVRKHLDMLAQEMQSRPASPYLSGMTSGSSNPLLKDFLAATSARFQRSFFALWQRMFLAHVERVAAFTQLLALLEKKVTDKGQYVSSAE